MLIITTDDEPRPMGAGESCNTGSQWSEVMGAGSWALWAEAIMGTGAGHKAHSALITSQLSGQEEVPQKKVVSAKMSVHDMSGNVCFMGRPS